MTATHVDIKFLAKASLRFLKYSPKVEQGSVKGTTYEIPDLASSNHQSVLLAIWDTSRTPAITHDVRSDNDKMITLPWYTNGTSHVKMAAFLDNNKLHVGSTCLPLKELQEIIRNSGEITLRHPCSDSCVVVLDVKASSQESPYLDDNQLKKLEPSKLTNFRQMNAITDRLSTQIREECIRMFHVIGPGLLPFSTAARNFVDLQTVLPLTMQDGSTLNIHMPFLQKTLAGRGESVLLPALVYLVHAASLMEGISPEDNLETMPPETIFKVYTGAQTMITADGGFNKYVSDRVPTGYTEGVSWDSVNAKAINLDLEETENIQVPFTQVLAQGDDCEDWAMAMYVIAMSFQYYSQRYEHELENRVTVAYNSFALATEQYACFSELSTKDITHLVERVLFIGDCVIEKKLSTCLMTVTAGAPSMQQGGGGVARQPGGHECCIAEAHFKPSQVAGRRTKKNEYHCGKVLEGTNWVNNTEDYNPKTLKRLYAEMEKVLRDHATRGLKPEGLRPQVLEAVGVRHTMHSDTFYRAIFSIDDKILMTMDATTNEITIWGTHIDNVLDSIANRDSSTNEKAYYAQLSKGSIPDAEWKAYEEYLTALAEEVQLPPMRDTEWKTRMQKWGKLPSQPPESFDEVHKKKDKAYMYFSTKNKYADSFPFMGVHISVVETDPVQEAALQPIVAAAAQKQA